jgi:hypothetical protein
VDREVELKRRNENRPYWLDKGIYVILENPISQLECVALIKMDTLLMCELGGTSFDQTGFYTYDLVGWKGHLDIVSAYEHYRSSIQMCS